MNGLERWAISGSYLESCNCDAICPCRRIGGRAGGRSTHGICLGALSWKVERGHAGGIDLTGLCAVMAFRYDDDEDRSPWDFWLYVDARGEQRQRGALAAILLGELGGTPAEQFPWVFKRARALGVRAARLDVDHTPGRGWFSAGGEVSVRVREPVADQEPVTCIVPGHHRAGRELLMATLAVHDGPLEFELHGSCGYESTFDYSSRDG